MKFFKVIPPILFVLLSGCYGKSHVVEGHAVPYFSNPEYYSTNIGRSIDLDGMTSSRDWTSAEWSSSDTSILFVSGESSEIKGKAVGVSVGHAEAIVTLDNGIEARALVYVSE